VEPYIVMLLLLISRVFCLSYYSTAGKWKWPASVRSIRWWRCCDVFVGSSCCYLKKFNHGNSQASCYSASYSILIQQLSCGFLICCIAVLPFYLSIPYRVLTRLRQSVEKP